MAPASARTSNGIRDSTRTDTSTRTSTSATTGSGSSMASALVSWKLGHALVQDNFLKN